jgi:DNA-binding transcriptional ArsR family regulator
MAGRRRDMPTGKTGRDTPGSDPNTKWKESVDPDIDEGHSVYYRAFTMNRAEAADLCCPPSNEQADLRPIEGVEADEELARLSKALGHPARVKILRVLVRRTTCICGEFVDELSLAQSTVSQHLKVLKDAGLIRGDVDGPRSCYCIEPRTLRRLRALIGGV